MFFLQLFKALTTFQSPPSTCIEVKAEVSHVQTWRKLRVRFLFSSGSWLGKCPRSVFSEGNNSPSRSALCVKSNIENMQHNSMTKNTGTTLSQLWLIHVNTTTTTIELPPLPVSELSTSWRLVTCDHKWKMLFCSLSRTNEWWLFSRGTISWSHRVNFRRISQLHFYS